MALLNILISIVCIKVFGVIGAAVGTALGILLVNGLLMNIYYHKVIHLNMIKFWKNIIKMTIPYIIPIGLVIVIMYFTNITGFLSLIIYGGIYVLLYLIVSYFIVMNDYEKKY